VFLFVERRDNMECIYNTLKMDFEQQQSTTMI
jgi:hypothetical protein